MNLLISTMFLFQRKSKYIFNEPSSLLGHTRSGRTRPPSLERPPTEEEAVLIQEGGKARRSKSFSSRAQAMTTSSLTIRSPGALPMQKRPVSFQCKVDFISFVSARLSMNKKIQSQQDTQGFYGGFFHLLSFCFHDFTAVSVSES